MTQPGKRPPGGESAELSVQRAFVVQFRSDTDLEHGPVAGRIEHVVSGQAAHFASVAEIVEFLRAILSSETASQYGRGTTNTRDGSQAGRTR